MPINDWKQFKKCSIEFMVAGKNIVIFVLFKKSNKEYLPEKSGNLSQGYIKRQFGVPMGA